MKTEAELIEWANRIKKEFGLTLNEIADDLAAAGIKNVSYQYICNALSRGVKTNGINIAIAIIEHYEGVRFKRNPDSKPMPYFAVDETIAA